MKDANTEVGSVSDADKRTAGYIMIVAACVRIPLALYALSLGGIAWTLVELALAGTISYLGYFKVHEGNLQVAKTTSLIVGGMILVDTFIFAVGGFLGFLPGLFVFATGGALIYAAMLISPGHKLFSR